METSSEFKPGQTVWWKEEPEHRLVIRAIDGKEAWISHPDGYSYTLLLDGLTTTDPNRPAEPVPQKCPKCQGETEMGAGLGAWRYIRCRGDCRMHGPLARNGLEAVQAWNSIRVEKIRCDAFLHGTLRDDKLGIRCALPSGHVGDHAYVNTDPSDWRCPIFVGGERCGKRIGHVGEHVWDRGD